MKVKDTIKVPELDKNNKVDSKIENFYKPFNFTIDDRLEKHKVVKKEIQENKNVPKTKIIEIDTKLNRVPLYEG